MTKAPVLSNESWKVEWGYSRYGDLRVLMTKYFNLEAKESRGTGSGDDGHMQSTQLSSLSDPGGCSTWQEEERPAYKAAFYWALRVKS